MPAPTHSDLNRGIRRVIPGLSAHRNFEPGGTQQYASNRSNLTINGTVYQPGANLPVGTLPDYLLAQLFNAGWINPTS